MTELGEIPEEWKIKKLKDIANICYGKSQKEVEVDDGKYKILGTGGVIGYTNDFLWNKQSVLIGRKGTIDKPQYIEEPFWTVDTLFYTKINENYIAKWFYYYLDNIDLKKYNEATGVPSLSVANLNTIRLATPTIKEQEKIASILSTVDEQIDNVDALIEKNKELKKGLMQTLLTKGIGHKKFKKTEIGEIPEAWEVVKFKEITDILRCGVASTPTYVENGIPFLSAQNVNNEKLSLHKYNFISEDYHKQLTKNDKPQKGDILYSRVGANYGIAAVVDIDFEFSVYVSLTLIRMKNEYDSRFYKYLLNSTIIRKQADIGVFQGGGVPNLNVKVVEKFNVVVPPKYEQIKIATILSEVDEKIEEYENKKQKLEELKKGLMQQLLTGKIRVINY